MAGIIDITTVKELPGHKDLKVSLNILTLRQVIN
jgi:hypothetical protein